MKSRDPGRTSREKSVGNGMLRIHALIHAFPLRTYMELHSVAHGTPWHFSSRAYALFMLLEHQGIIEKIPVAVGSKDMCWRSLMQPSSYA